MSRVGGRANGAASRPRRAGARWRAAVLAITLAGLVLRLWNVDFDERQHQHPDERHWALTSSQLANAPAPARHGTVAGPVLDWLDGQRSPANAYRGADSFVYGPATLAATRGVAGWLEEGAVDGSQPASALVGGLDRLGVPLLDASGGPRFDDGYDVDLVGRVLGAFADAATIVVVALIGRRLGGRTVGVAAAGFAATSVLAIQHAHYFGSEPVLGLAAALTVLATLRMDRGHRIGPALGTGLVAGLAAGATVAAKLSGVGAAAVPALLCGWLLVRHRRPSDLARLAGVGLGALVAFRVLYPSAFDGLGLGLSATFLEDQRRTREVAGMGLPPSVQWAGRIPVLEPLRWLFLFTVGPGASLAAVGGAAVLVRGRRAVGRWPVAVVVGSVLVPLAVVLRGSVTTGRYFVPLLPALHVCAGVGLVALVRWAAARERQPVARHLARASAAGLAALSLLWAVAFVAGVHGHDHTRVAASRWIAANVEPGSTLTVESWDDGLPLALPGIDPSAYRSEELDLFAGDRLDRVQLLADQLGRVDYVVESSPRVSRALVRIPARYPSSIRFFAALDDGTLGFERAATFTSPPRLGPFRLDDATAEEAFSVYDHPEVRIWRRVRTTTVAERLARLDPVAAATALEVHPDVASANGALLHDDERAETDRIGTYAQAFDRGGSPVVHALGWLLVLELVGLVAFALLAPALRVLPDAGAGLAKAAGLVACTFGVFVATAWWGVPLTRGLIAAVVGTWLLVGGWAARRNRTLLRELWATRRRTLLQVEVIGLVAFVALLLLRAANPDLWHVYRGGEKPFELEMLTATLRTRTLPPYDPWYSGGTLNYYYGGYLLLSVPARLLRTAPELTMNLALAAFGALASGAAWSAGAALATLRRNPPAAGGRDEPTGLDASGRTARRAGFLTVLAVLVLPSASIVAPVVRRALGSEQGTLDWWGLSRTIPGAPVVTEFPAWSILFGDVHPHVLDLPVLLALVAVAVAWYRVLREPGATTTAVVGLAVLVGVLVGMVRAVNTWDLPLAAGLAALAPLGALVASAPRRRCGLGAAVALGVVVVGWAPYAWRTEVTDAGVEVESLHTPFTSALAHFGFLGATTLVVLGALAVGLTAADRRRAIGGGLALAGLAVVVGLAIPERSVLAAAIGLAVASVAGAALVRRRDAPAPPGARSPVGPVPLLAIGMGWLVVAGIEVVSVVNDFERQNTVFKGWYQAWLLLALGHAVALAGLALAAPRIRLGDRPGPWRVRLPVTAARAVLGVAVLLITAFVQLAVPARLADRTSAGGWSLDGAAHLDRTVVGIGEQQFRPGDDRPLIDWLQEHVTGIPTVAEAPGDDYSWSGRIAAATGLPAIVGWPYHQSQQRRAYEASVNERVADAAAIYTSADASVITSVLQRYRVAYVVFGTTERALAPAAGRRALQTHPCLTVTVQAADLFVAAVDQPCLAEQPGALPLTDP